MRPPVVLKEIPEDQFPAYRREVIFGAYKWDPQVEDHGTIARHVALIDRDAAAQLESWAEELARETVMLEEALSRELPLARKLGFPSKLHRELGRMENYQRNRHVRLMRFDFHPTASGWDVSEVNSDVPGGFAEASLLPAVAARYAAGGIPGKSLGDSLLHAFQRRLPPGGTVAFVHATSYSDDRQVMEYLSQHFEDNGFQTLFAAPDHIAWRDRRAVSILEGLEGPVDGIVRFFPLEWLANLPRLADWRGFYHSETPSCNHPIAAFAQSKRLPLVWDRLGVDIPTWRKLLPETRDPRTVPKNAADWIYKPALGRVGEGISIREAVPDKELRQIRRAARHQPGDWVAQRRFQSLPLEAECGEIYHLCVGVFTVDGRSAGFYGRISLYPRIDAKARDIPLLLTGEG